MNKTQIETLKYHANHKVITRVEHTEEPERVTITIHLDNSNIGDRFLMTDLICHAPNVTTYNPDHTITFTWERDNEGRIKPRLSTK